MSQGPPLYEQLHRWRDLTEQERALIEDSAWPALPGVQGLKAALQREILASSRSAQDRGSMVTLVHDLILLEEENLELLNGKLAALSVEKRRLRRSCHDLRAIQQAYVKDMEGSWEMYS